jgi:hypothetical protein
LPIVAVARTPDGTEAQSAVTDRSSLPRTIAALRSVMPPDGSVGAEPVSSVPFERYARYRAATQGVA